MPLLKGSARVDAMRRRILIAGDSGAIAAPASRFADWSGSDRRDRNCRRHFGFVTYDGTASAK